MQKKFQKISKKYIYIYPYTNSILTVITNPITKYDKLFWKYLLSPQDPIFSFLGTSLLAVISTFGEVYVNATKRKHFSKTGTTLFLGDFGLDVCCNSALSAPP